MDRRNSIKALVLGTVSTGVLVEACKNNDAKGPDTPKEAVASAEQGNEDRMRQEIEYNKELQQEKFFTEPEMATLAVFADIIIPKDDVSGGATEAKVPDFIEFMMKDKPDYQTPMRGGLRWVDMHCLNEYGKAFTDITKEQQMALVDNIAYPKKAKPEYKPGVAFFSLMRNFTVTGFYTSELGLKDLGYMGNSPNKWNGVPDDVLKQYNMAYSEKELKECASY